MLPEVHSQGPLRVQPRDAAIAQHELGLDFAGQKRWEEAIAAFRESIRLSAGYVYVTAYSDLAHALADAGR